MKPREILLFVERLENLKVTESNEASFFLVPNSNSSGKSSSWFPNKLELRRNVCQKYGAPEQRITCPFKAFDSHYLSKLLLLLAAIFCIACKIAISLARKSFTKNRISSLNKRRSWLQTAKEKKFFIKNVPSFLRLKDVGADTARTV